MALLAPLSCRRPWYSVIIIIIYYIMCLYNNYIWIIIYLNYNYGRNVPFLWAWILRQKIEIFLKLYVGTNNTCRINSIRQPRHSGTFFCFPKIINIYLFLKFQFECHSEQWTVRRIYLRIHLNTNINIADKRMVRLLKQFRNSSGRVPPDYQTNFCSSLRKKKMLFTKRIGFNMFKDF